MKSKRPKELISRAFKSDFPELYDRAKALGVRISLSRGGRDRVYWLDGYKQLTGYATNSDGSPFAHRDEIASIEKALAAVEEDRSAIQNMNEEERFARVICEFRKMKVQYRMIGEVRFPSGDGGHCFFNAAYDGAVRLAGSGTVAKAQVPWKQGVGPAEQMTLFCDMLEHDYANHRSTAA